MIKKTVLSKIEPGVRLVFTFFMGIMEEEESYSLTPSQTLAK